MFEEKLYLLPDPKQSCTLSQALDENKLLLEDASAQEIACLFTSFVDPAETLLEELHKRARGKDTDPSPPPLFPTASSDGPFQKNKTEPASIIQ